MSRGLSRQQVAMLLVMRQRETTCARSHGRERFVCGGCATTLRDIYESLYLESHNEEMRREKEYRQKDYPAGLAAEEDRQIARIVATRGRPFTPLSRQVSIARAFRSLRHRGYVHRVRHRYGYQWHTMWYKAPA